MHHNRYTNDFTKSKINYPTGFISKSLAEAQSKLEVNQHEKTSSPEENEAGGDIERSYRPTAATYSADSTDSGVNLSDNDDIPPPSHKCTPSNSLETHSTASDCHKKFHKPNKNVDRDNNINNNEDNNSKNVNNSNSNIDSYVNIVDRDDDTKNMHSQNPDNKFKVSDKSRCQQQTQNFVQSANAANVCQQRNLETLAPTTTPMITTTTTSIKECNDAEASIQYNEFIRPQKRNSSTASSSSMSSNTNSCDDHLPSNMRDCKGSPVVSIRSINSTIITSDSDTDSDLNSDEENYVIQKLGTQVTYSPNDPAIPNISSGHAVLNEKVILNGNQVPLPPLEALAVIGDRIGTAQALGPVPSNSGVAQRPQIGSIALSNSNDVTFGDKHFYEGPVTIQQFLIDSRDKRKEANGKDNPAFSSENVESPPRNAKDTYPEAEKSNTVYEYILKRRKIIIPGVLAFTALFIVATIWGSKMLTESKNTNNTFGDCVGNGALCSIERDVWRAHPQTGILDKQKLPLHRVVISHTASEPCDSIQTCSSRVRVIQEFHMNSLGWDDIGYNFLVGSDGRAYVGRGWDYVGAHTKGYNYDSVGITFIAQDNVGGGYVFRLVPRDGWLAQPPANPWVKLKLPVGRVIVIPTRTSDCETQAACTYTVRITQTYNIESQQQDDIIYNFLIGGDGNVYEGRGWDNRGSVIKGFNDDSISFAFIGSFKRQQPSYKQLNVTKLLLEEGVRLKKLSSNYIIVGANKLDPSSVATSADALYKSFENWPHWSDKEISH